MEFDDIEAVFYNPAGLALNPRYTLNLVNPKFDVSADDITGATELRDAFSGLDAASLSKFFQPSAHLLPCGGHAHALVGLGHQG